MNPYSADPSCIPPTDLYADIPLYGRYLPKPDDFHVNDQHINFQSPESIRYWDSVIELCNESIRIYPADEGGRDVFALGSVIYICAISIAKNTLKDIRVPEIYFAGKIRGRQVLVQERLPGVTLGVAWPYLSRSQKDSFKEQAREILRQLHRIKPSDRYQYRSHIVQDPEILSNGRINPLERDIIFSETNIDPDMSFMHNDFTPSNCIVDNDKIVGLIDWEMAGFFGWKTAGKIHRRIRKPQRERFANTNLSEERLQDIMYWNDLYDCMPEH